MTTVIHLVAAGESYTFSGRNELTLGRGDTCDVRFASPYVSRVHGKLTHTDSGWVYEDLRSTRGTHYRGAPIQRLALIGPAKLLLGEPGKGEEVQITPENPAQIFICYRREDAGGHAGRLYDRLAAEFGESQVFLDIDRIRFGEDFVERTTAVVESCRVVLVMIGRDWLDVRDAAGYRRIDDHDDYVRVEIRAALRRTSQVTTIPVLVRGATMPREEDLPGDLAPLARRNAITLPDGSWHIEVGRLIEQLETIMRAPAPAPE